MNAPAPRLTVEAEPANASNPNPLNPSAPPIAAFHQTNACEVSDLNHSVSGSHAEFDNGRMDGFTKANEDASYDPTGSRTMGYHTQAEIPYYYALADKFATGDRYFASELGPTFPNRFFLLAATPFGHTTNDFPVDDPLNAFSQKTIFEELDAAHISWRVYFAEVPFAAIFGYVRQHAVGHLFPIAQYFIDAATGTLPQVSFVDPVFLGTNNTETDEHPTTNIQLGEKFSSTVINALMTGASWPSRTSQASPCSFKAASTAASTTTFPRRPRRRPTPSARMDRSTATGSACRWSSSHRSRNDISFLTLSTITRRSYDSSRPASDCPRLPRATRPPIRCTSSSPSSTRTCRCRPFRMRRSIRTRSSRARRST